ncbi:MAG: M6 family metalloprotease domain-containing protein, partial [Campylobacterota bacterium]|nr:M6 family metalloprotease domain-containing protein [Campylobacterota bacterium]
GLVAFEKPRYSLMSSFHTLLYDTITIMKTFFLFIFIILLFQGCGETPTSDKNPNEAPPITQISRALLVIQLSYNDIQFTDSDPSVWANKIFGNAEGELNHFYAQNSQNLFSFIPVDETSSTINDGVMDVKLNKNHPNPENNYRLLHPDFKQALTLLDSKIDFSTYDLDSNNALSSEELLIIFIVAGNEEAYGISTLPGVFAHQYCITGSDVAKLDNVTIMGCSSDGNYAVFGERHDNNRRNASIGIIAHELGHAAFDLPDLYDTTPSTEPDSAGIGYFGLMSAGMWGTKAFGEPEGTSPAHMCAWSKIQNGWVEPELIDAASALHVNLSENSSDNYNVVKIPINDSEYFLLENRNNSGYDRGLFAIDGLFKGGMALWRVNETIINSNKASNTVNANKENKGLALIEANRAQLDISPYKHGHEKNLFYQSNRSNYHKDFITIENISSRSEVMSATISK